MIGPLLAWLYPACAETGTQGLPIPDPVSIARLAEDRPGAAALAAPENFDGAVDVPTRLCPASAEDMFAAFLRVGTTQPRTFLAAAYPTRLQAHFVARSARMNFPDVIVAEARAVGSGSVAVIYSQSVYGRSGAGAQRRRLQEWVAALDADLAGSAEGQV